MISELRKRCLEAELKQYCIDQMEYIDEYFIAEYTDGNITVEELDYIKNLSCTVDVREKEDSMKNSSKTTESLKQPTKRGA